MCVSRFVVTQLLVHAKSVIRGILGVTLSKVKAQKMAKRWYSVSVLSNYEKKILINDLILDLKLGYYEFEREHTQKVKFSLEIDYEDKKPTSDKDIKSIVNYGQVVKLIKKLTKNRHYNFLETLAEDVFDILFKDKRIGKIMLQIEKLEILKECTSVGIQITKKRSHEKL